jgi:hypothetical protein
MSGPLKSPSKFQDAVRLHRQGQSGRAKSVYLECLAEGDRSAHLGLGDLARERGAYSEALGEYLKAYQAGFSQRNVRQLLTQCLRYRPAEAVNLALEDLVWEGLSWTDTDPQSLVPATVEILKKDPRFATCWDDPKSSVQPLLKLPLLLRLFRYCLADDLRLEQMFRRLRYHLLRSRTSKKWRAALAWQAYYQDYLHDPSSEEKAWLDRLRTEAPEPDALLTLAMYENIGALPGCDTWGPFRGELGVLSREVIDARLEREEIARALPRLGSGCTPDSLIVRKQYEKNPYPRWRCALRLPDCRCSQG